MRLKYLVLSAVMAFIFSGLTMAGGGISGIISQQVANQVSRSTSNAISKNLADRLIIPTLKIKNESGEVFDIDISHDSKLLALLHEDDSVRVWDLGKGVQRPTIKATGNDFKRVAVASKENLIVTGGENGEINVYQGLTGKLKQTMLSNNGDVTALSIGENETKLLVAYENGSIIIWDLSTFIQLSEIKTAHDDDIRFVVFEAQNNSFIIAGNGGFVERWAIKKAEKIKALAEDVDDVIGLWTQQVTAGHAIFMDADGILQQTGQAKGVLGKRFVNDLISIAINNNLSKIAVSTEEHNIKFFSVEGMRFLGEIKRDKDFFHLKFINHGKQLLAADEKGILYLFDVNTRKELLKLISTETGWTVVDNKGRFDSSEKGLKNISWEAEDDELPIDSFSGTHYEPGLLASHLDDQHFINEEPTVVQQGIKLPPEVVITIPDGDKVALEPFVLSVEAQGLGGGVDKVNLYHNGKIVVPESVVKSSEETNDKLIKKTVEFKLLPLAGENSFKVIATNKMGIEGYSDEVTINFEGKKQKSTLHILTIGINKYRDSRLNLDYSVADATEISNVFKKSQLAVYDDVVHHQLRDNEATKKAILKQFNEINNYSQNDVVVLYLAGHGLAVEGEWFYLPHETILQDNQNYYTQVGVSAKEIQKILTNSKVQSVMVMIDACYSGAGLQAFRKLQDTQRHFSRALSKSVGVVVLAATRQDQEAAELSDLGHGLFTYVVTDGLSGKADYKPKNLKISAHELADFSTETIPTFSRKYLGAAQEPTSFTMGSDFVLLRK